MIITQIDPPTVEVSADVMDRITRILDTLTDLGNILPIFVGILSAVVIIGSGAFSAAIAERKQRSRNFHFVLGLFIPIVYPMFAYTLMPRRKYSGKEEAPVETVRIDGAPPVEGPPIASIEETSHIPKKIDPNAPGAIFNQSTFKSMMTDSTGKARGPFLLDIEGVELRAERILDATPDVAVLETINADGKQQTIRLPYARIYSCREI